MADDVIDPNDGTENINPTYSRPVYSEPAYSQPAPSQPAFSGILERIAWGAVWAGVLVAVSMEVLFTLFGLFIGFGMYHYRAASPWGHVGAWSAIWYIVTAAWSMFFGAWIAARLSGNPTAGDGILHGISVWGLATFITLAGAAFASWAVLREGIVVMSTVAQTAPGAVAPFGGVSPPTPQMGQATASMISGISLRLFGGLLIGFVAAIFGGWLGRSRSLVVSGPNVVPLPTRRVA